MCVIIGPVKEVKKTKLYVSHDTTRTKQLTIYENSINTRNNNAMVLAVPNPSSVEFIDLSSYKTIFTDASLVV